ncbi:hypothetical protein F5Y17DRAFT_258558 [Xylariaceae sp. FL0594]|nr:hypothetical protein F5Y17DRAFT_258558 [Xylariaceae sp. FL0594]
MEEIMDRVHLEPPSSARLRPRKERPRSRAPEKNTESSTANAKKLRRKPVICSEDSTVGDSQSMKPVPEPEERQGDILVEVPLPVVDSMDEVRGKTSSNERDSSATSPLIKADQLSGPSHLGLGNESEDTSGSGETVTQVPSHSREGISRGVNSKPKKYTGTMFDALRYLDSGSPRVTSDSIQRAVKESARLASDGAESAPSSSQASSYRASDYPDDLLDSLGDQGTNRSTSPEHGIDGEPRGRPSGGAGPRMRPERRMKRSYGSPEMPNRNVQQAYPSPEQLTPRVPYQQYANHVPRSERLPLSGYELLASKLSATWSDHPGPQLRPIYRRFEALNHRLLLHLQDEICELEEQLHHLDAADTQARRLQNGILPASRRAEYMAGGELQWHKTDILSKIGFKLEQYNRVLASFRDTQYLSVPAPAEVQTYRHYLARYSPIIDTEARFLDATDDLICFGFTEEDVDTLGDDDYDRDTATSPSRIDAADFETRRHVSSLSQSDISRPQDNVFQARAEPPLPKNHAPISITLISIAVAGSIVVPILTFFVIPGFLGRVTVVCLVGIATVAGLIQAQIVRVQLSQESCLCLALYGVIMALLAGMVG